MQALGSRPCARRVAKLAVLFGSASFAVMASTAAEAADAVQAAPVEEVLITGSLIRGAPAVGVPVTALSTEDFEESGAITIAEMLKNVPVFDVIPSLGAAMVSGANRQRLQNAEIHGIGGQSTAALLMVNGKRYPIQGTNLENVDPSIIPQLAIDRIDVLAAGASATYGSDAVAGVINIILKRNYNGAMTRGSVGMSTDLGWESANFAAAQLFGRTWDNLADLGAGGITISYDWWERRAVKGPGRDYFTVNFEPYGFDDRIPLASNFPGIVSTGNPSAAGLPYTVPAEGTLSAGLGTRYCNNCYSIPQGAGWNFGDQPPGPTTTWTTLLANKGVKNQRDIYDFSSMNPAQQSNAATLVLDQELLQDVLGTGVNLSFFTDAFYQQRRNQIPLMAGWYPCARCLTVANGVPVPTTNPYRPTGAPAAINAHYSVAVEHPVKVDSGSVSGQYAVGFNFEGLPFDWRGSAFFASSEETSWERNRNVVNVNMFNAAIGNTVPSAAASGSAPVHAAFTKPANVPYLNLFCDSTVYRCNSPQTLAYIRAFRDLESEYEEREFGINFDGPLFDLPGGTVRGAVAAQNLKQRFFFENAHNETTFHTEIVQAAVQYNKQVSWAIFGQLNVPLIDAEMGIPLVEELILEGGYRYDHYDAFGGVKSPKLQANWGVGWGLTFRGAYGTSFNTPPFGLIQNFTGVGSSEEHAMINVPGSRATQLALNCPAHANAVPAPIAQGTAQPGSLQAYLNPLRYGCPDPDGAGPLTAGPTDPFAGQFNSLSSPVGIDQGGSYLFLQGIALEPETSDQWSLGVMFAPDAPILGVDLSGFVVDVTWWRIQRENQVANIAPGSGINDPNSFNINEQDDAYLTRFQVIPRPDLLLSAPENASFKARVDRLIGTGRAAFDPAALEFVKYIDIAGLGNQKGFTEIAGIDFSIRYDWDMGTWGSMNARVSGAYETRNRTQSNPLAAVNSAYTQTRPDGRVVGANSGHQMQRMRFNLGWNDMDAHWSVVAGANWRPHHMGGGTPPACYWRNDYGPTGAPGHQYCYPGAPYFPQPFYEAPAGTNQPTQRYGGVLQPSIMFFDLYLGYDTGDLPSNTYLQNIRLGLNINNILNRLPSAIDYDARTSGGSPRIREGNEMQRTVTFSVTKVW